MSTIVEIPIQKLRRGSDGCNDKDELGYCLQQPGAHICKGTDICYRWAQVYAVKELTAAVKAVCRELKWAGQGE